MNSWLPSQVRVQYCVEGRIPLPSWFIGYIIFLNYLQYEFSHLEPNFCLFFSHFSLIFSNVSMFQAVLKEKFISEI